MSVPDPTPDPAKKPLPLLSRRKGVTPPPLPSRSSATAEKLKAARAGAAAVRSKRSFQIFLRVLAGLSLLALGWEAAHLGRQTSVQGLVVAPAGYVLPQEACIVRDFSADLHALRGEAARARLPYESQLRDKQENMSRVQEDVSGLDERKKLITDEIDQIQADIESAVSHTREEADALWKREGTALDAAYAAKMQAFRQTLLQHASQLHLSPELDPQSPSPEIWVNSFRLSLYNPPPTVKAPAERDWLEKQLVAWHAYEKSYDADRAALKAKADAIRQGLGGELDTLHARIEKRNEALSDIEDQQAPLQAESGSLQSESESVRASLADQQKVYIAQLSEIPQGNVLEKLPLSPEGRFSWDHLEENPKYPPGHYLLWIPVHKGEEERWAVVPFTIEEKKCLDLIIQPGAFVATEAVLQ